MPNTDDEVVTSLKRSRDNVLALIEEVTSQPKPTYSIDGQKVEWAAYLKQLHESLEALEVKIENKDGPYEEHSTFYVPS